MRSPIRLASANALIAKVSVVHITTVIEGLWLINARRASRPSRNVFKLDLPYDGRTGAWRFASPDTFLHSQLPMKFAKRFSTKAAIPSF